MERKIIPSHNTSEEDGDIITYTGIMPCLECKILRNMLHFLAEHESLHGTLNLVKVGTLRLLIQKPASYVLFDDLSSWDSG